MTPDHVNPEAPWPALRMLEQRTAQAGKVLVGRLAIYPAYLDAPDRWLDPALRTPSLRASDADNFARPDGWIAGAGHDTPIPLPPAERTRPPVADRLQALFDRPGEYSEDDLVTLFSARGTDFLRVCEAADALRARVNGDTVSYVVTRNINYTNICYFRCKFCAFSKGKLAANLRGKPYNLGLEEIQRRATEAWERGATEVCLQGGIHPDYTGETYLSICRAIKDAVPGMHIHAFSPLEIHQGAETLGIPVATLLERLQAAGLGTLPGTAAEILDDDVRAVICPDKVNTRQWLDIVETAHRVGLKTTATIMYGHVDRPRHWARHLLRLRELQTKTGGITELVPLPFVPMETPIYLHGRARSGTTFREAVLVHAVARLALHPLITNIQTSWVKMGPEGVKWCLRAGANDAGGTLMDESITRSAGATHGQEMPPAAMESLIASIGRTVRQRTTLYRDAPAEQHAKSLSAASLIRPMTDTAA